MPLMYNANTPEGTLPSIDNISIASLGDANARMNAHPDVASVRRKIASVAAYYDPQRGGGLKGFNGAELDPTALKEQLRRNFGIQVTPAELGALVTLFDKDGDGTVDCRWVGLLPSCLPRHYHCRHNGRDRSAAIAATATANATPLTPPATPLAMRLYASAPTQRTLPSPHPHPPHNHRVTSQRVPARVFQNRQE